MVKLFWYGERGIINALVVALQLSGLPGVRAFLAKAIWDGEPPAWLSTIIDVAVIIEVDCHQFGGPDLIVVCTTEDQRRFVVFIEAKVVTYKSSAVRNEAGIWTKGFNSAINGQLSLKFRFAHALAAWDGQRRQICEPQQLYQAYRRPPNDGGLGDPIASPRHLQKESVLALLREAGMHGLATEQFYFVALTWDREAFFQDEGFRRSDLRPLFLDGNGNERWDTVSSRVGWIGYQVVHGLEVLCDAPGESFRQACRTMLPTLTPPMVVTDGEPVNSININRFTDATVQRLGVLEELARNYFHRVERLTGSTSVTFAGKVMLKLIPQAPGPDEIILLGVSTVLERRIFGGVHFDDACLINSQPFYTWLIPNTPEGLDTADAVFLEVAELFGIQQEDE